MKPKNIILLGFINKAVDYLDEHMDDEINAQDDADKSELLFLKQQLGGNLETILGTKQSTVSALLQAGNEAFDSFINGKIDTNISLSKQIDDMLSEPSNNKFSRPTNQQLSKYISSYNFEPDYDDKDYFSNDDNLMKQIRKNATNPNYKVEDKINIPSPDDGLDSIFSEIVDNENNNETINETKQSDRFKYLVSELKKEISKDENNNLQTNKNINNQIKKIKNVKPIQENVNNSKKASQNINQNNLFNNFKKKLEKQEIPDEYINVYQDDNALKENEDKDSYVNNLIDNFKKKLEVEEENKKTEVLKRISKIYTYLPQDFIERIYDLKKPLAEEYPFNRKIIILHRVKFTDVENLRQFVEICLNHGYTINADEKKMIVDVFKEHVNADGKILTNIYEISNQSFLLNAIYEGYNVIVLDK